jgi:predicted RNA binding protein with dsRBD fold (UPF0201 family)
METDRSRDPEVNPDIEILIECKVNPSEDAEKLVLAIKNIFPNAVLEMQGTEMSGRAHGLETLTEKIRKQRIRNTVRAHLIRSLRRVGEIEFYLNKQVAFVGAVNLANEEVILGGIRVRVRASDPEAAIKELTA